MQIIEETKDYVDWYVLGALNYTKQLKLPYTKQQLKDYYMKHVVAAIRLLESLNKKYHIKKELKKYLGDKL